MARKNVVSINIGSRRTKIVVGSYEKEKIYVEKAVLIDTPKDSLSDGKLLKADSASFELGKAVSKALSDNKIRYKETIVTIQSTMGIRRELNVPKVKPKDMESMIRYEIEQYLPIDLNEYIIEHKVLEEKQENKSRILIAALPKTIADDYYKMLNAIGLEPKALDINSNSVSKLFGFSQRLNNQAYNLDSTVAFIDLGYKSINITIVSKGDFQFSRLLPAGGSELDAAIADMYGISEQDAEKKKHQAVDLTMLSEEGEAKALNEMIAEIIGRWIEDMQRVFQYYKTRSANNNIDRIYLFGGTSNMKGIAEYFENTIGVPTQKITSLDSVVFEKGLSGSGIGCFINSIGTMIRK